MNIQGSIHAQAMNHTKPPRGENAKHQPVLQFMNDDMSKEKTLAVTATCNNNKFQNGVSFTVKVTKGQNKEKS